MNWCVAPHFVATNGDQMNTPTNNTTDNESERNSIRIIKPYKFAGTWVFDDDNTDLVREPFVGEVNDIIDVMTGQMEGAEEGFGLIFSALSLIHI